MLDLITEALEGSIVVVIVQVLASSDVSVLVSE